jgi:hypothetical protein
MVVMGCRVSKEELLKRLEDVYIKRNWKLMLELLEELRREYES